MVAMARFVTPQADQEPEPQTPFAECLGAPMELQDVVAIAGDVDTEFGAGMFEIE